MVSLSERVNLIYLYKVWFLLFTLSNDVGSNLIATNDKQYREKYYFASEFPLT